MAPHNFKTIIHLHHYTGNGETQMALDRALCDWVTGQHENTLIWRTYSWTPQCWSLGCHQKASALSQLTSDSTVDIVKRPTGGRAILHGEDVSFAFVSNAEWLRKQHVSESYCIFQRWVREALASLAVQLASTCDKEKTLGYQHRELCFETKTTYDLTDSTGNKISGAAQLKTRDALLQHGVVFIKPYVNSPQILFEPALYRSIQEDLKDLTFQSEQWQNMPTLKALVEHYKSLQNLPVS